MDALDLNPLKPLDRLRRSIFALPLAAMAALIVVVINETSFNESTSILVDLAEHGSARLDLQALMLGLAEAETGKRGYLLTNRRSYLVPYERARVTIDATMRRLVETHGKDPATRQQMLAIERKTQERMSELSTALEMHAAGKETQWRALLESDIGREKMEELRELSSQFLEQRNANIQVRRADLIETLRLNRIGVNVMAALALMAVLLFLRESRTSARAQAAHDLALQLERDRLEVEVVRRTAESTELARHLQSAREDERARLARELHDELGALLTAAKLDVARLKRSVGEIQPAAQDRLKSLNGTIDNGIALKRRIIEDLRPSSLSNLGLVAALEILAREFTQRTEIKVHTMLEHVTLDDEGQITVYRVVQEALTNAAKYAKASEVTISLGSDGERVTVGIEDNGIGFDQSRVRHSTHGLTGMRYRAEGQRGGLQIKSTPGRGTQLELWLPVRRPPANDTVDGGEVVDIS
ncbi:MAG TPA: CHASE3 domain-containing protein [Rubrivivax sp.]